MLKFFFEARQLTKLALPAMLLFLSQKSLQFIDALMLGRLGSHALAAVAMGSAFFLLALMFCLGILSVIGAYISRAFGLNTAREIRRTMQHSFFLVCILAVPSMGMLWLMPDFLQVIGLDESIVIATRLFMRGLVWGFPATLSFLVLREFLSAFALAKIILHIGLAAIPLTFFVDYIFIYGKLGMPVLGIAGGGYAGAIVQWSMLISLLLYIFYHPLLKSYLFYFDLSDVSWKKMFEMLRMGLPYGVMLVLDISMGGMAILMMGYFGADVLAAHYIVVQCLTLVFCLPFSYSMAIAQRISSTETPSQSVPFIKHIVISALIIMLSLAFFVAILFNYYSDFLITLFVGNPARNLYLRQFAVTFFTFAAVFQCFDTIQASMNGVLRGVKDTLLPMICSIVGYWLGIGGAYLFAFYFALGARGVWYGLILGIMFVAVALCVLFSRRAYNYSLLILTPSTPCS
ncbi:MAG: hypothetical protein A3E83_00805 [Gammaproteobacteria bacterium RIFCSPHIGHO2_12_FULL_41_20]|nr:MAG: hypothetical protein A3E83_00805 [Gammaproteobacteria bacterium RIFCSPHIGHO2_12_FULL_41_20]